MKRFLMPTALLPIAGHSALAAFVEQLSRMTIEASLTARRRILPLLLLFLCTAQSLPAIEMPAGLEWDKRKAGDVIAASLKSPQSVADAEQVRFSEELDTRNLHQRMLALKAELPIKTRGLKEVQLYASISSAVVLIVTNDGIGSGSLVEQGGKILTNWHVVGDAREVAVIFKPKVEGSEISERDVHRAQVLRIDQVADLALLQVSDPPKAVKPIELGAMSDAPIGTDVHAIGHPTGESWTYTKGIVSQVRRNYQWTAEPGLKHQADVIQTQTPINPGSSGGPLLTEDGRLVGVNSFKAQGEALNFAVSVDDVRKFLANTTDRRAEPATRQQPPQPNTDCKTKELERGRSRENNADVVLYDITCDKRWDVILEIPDDQSEPITLSFDTNDSGKIDIIVVDSDRDGKWDFSFHDTDGDGEPDLVGDHPDGLIKPSRFEPYVASR